MAVLTAEAGSASAIDAACFGPYQFRIAALCALIAGLDGFDTQAIAYVAPTIAEAWKLDKAAFGPIFGVGLLGLTIGAFLLSPVADRIGRKLVIILCTAIFGLFALLTAGATSMDQLLLYRLLTGIGLGGAMPNLIAITSEYAPARLKATLVTVMFCGFPLGSTIGGIVSAPLIARFGWEAVFLLGGILPLLLIPLLWIALPESARFLAARPDPERRLTPILKRIDPSIIPAHFIEEVRSEAGGGPIGKFPVAELFRGGRAQTTALLWIAFFMNLLVMYFLVNWLPSLLRSLGLSLEIAIASTAILNLGGVFGAIVLGRLIDKREPAIVLGLAYLASAAFIFIISHAGANVVLLLAGAAAAGFGIVGGQIGLNAVAASVYPNAIRSTGVGWALGVGRIGSILGPVAGGALLGLGWSSQHLLLIAIVPALLASAAVFLLRKVR
ncbi:MFS transporter [Sphingobium yanoikuyae]|uniref:MFS transporter n=1 Tax=Sphingobium yanoikuyae TaxID=13690 RepID=UPI0008475730|nr:MFS transporter [Sphingobium yanoikuyae]